MAIQPVQQIPSAGQIELLPTPDPSTVSFRISESAQSFRVGDIPKQGTKFANTRLTKSRVQQDNFANYTYQYMDRDRQNLWFYFTYPYSTDIDPETGSPKNQVPFNTFSTNKRWSWPAVLHRLIFVPSQVPLITAVPNADDTKGYAQAFVERLVPRRVFTPATNALCECLVEQFVSDVPFEGLEHQQPVDGEVEWDLPGTSERITCLHPRIEIPAKTGKKHNDGTVKRGMKITKQKATELLASDLNTKYAPDVERYVTVELNQDQFDALVSFHFNTGALGRSTLLRKLNQGDFRGAAGEFGKWTRGGGKVLSGLVRRRRAEKKLFESGVLDFT